MNTTFRITFSYFLFILIFLSCRKDKNDSGGNILTQWNVVDIVSVESKNYAKNDGYNPVIQFYPNGSVTLKLNANNCIGDFSLTGEGSIKITMTGCTEICCDNDFSEKIQETLSLVESYEIDKSKMKLNVPGWGWINLELYH